MRMLNHPKYEETDQLRQIWCEGFPDDKESYCDFYFTKYFRPKRCLAVYNDTEIESAIHWFEAYYKDTVGNKQKFIFLYAGATLKKYRGNNNLQFMVKGCQAFSKENGYAGTVFAAADELVYLYDRWGYNRISKLHTYSVNVKRHSDILHWQICPFKKFQILRNTYLDKIGNCFYWYGDSEKYMYDDIFTKGDILFCEYDNTEFYAVCTIENDGIIIRETSFPLNEAKLLNESICKYYSYCGKVHIYTHENDVYFSKEYVSEDIYYGHYGINFDFRGGERLGSSYINLIAD